MKKINFENGVTKANATTMNTFQNNIEEAIGEAGKVTGVKGNAESSYRTGNVNLTPTNVGALPLVGGTLTGQLSARNVVPSVGGTYNLGSAGALWKSLYLAELISTSFRLYNSSSTAVMGVGVEFTVRHQDNINMYMPMSASAFNVNSSRRYKKNIREMTEDEAKKVDDIDVVMFDYRNEENGRNVAGAIAEDVYEILPGVVTLKEVDGEKVPDSIDYSKFVPYLIKRVQMLEKRVTELESGYGK